MRDTIINPFAQIVMKARKVKQFTQIHMIVRL